jgi:beta-lactam-binding protein with PASTA domain/predicted Ser/Thr protein kinase
VIGRVFDDRYEIVSKLGTGGMADVYLANDRHLGRQVALKVLSARYAHDEQFVERFRREASAAAGLNHPNIVQIYDRGQVEGTYYIAMEYLEGRSLKEIILKYAPLSTDLVLSVSTQILEALRFAHRRDVIHRDIKPQNIIVANDGRVNVTDFGIARAGSVSTMTEAGSILGTAHYLSPEQAQGKPVEAASDLYSLGIVMYEMATGKLPFDADNPVSIAMKHAHDQPAPPRSIVPDIPENLEAVILRALGKQPIDRYLTAQAMLDDLARVQAGEPVSAPAAYAEEATTIMSAAAAAAAAGAAGAQLTQIRRRATDDSDFPTDSYYAEPPRRGNVWPWILVIVLILALAGAAYAIFSSWGSAGGEMLVVPSVLGMSEEEAKQMIEDAGFKLDGKGEQASVEYEAGQVCKQDPEALTKLKKGESVSVWLSSGEETVEVPDLVGKTELEAGQELGARGLYPDRKGEATADEKLIGKVLRQNPTGGESVGANSTVTIWVGESSNMVSVPRLIGMNEEVAVARIRELNLVPDVKTVESTLTGGTVVEQTPAEGAKVAPNSTVSISISNAPLPTTVIVPAVAGLGYTQQQATEKLSQYLLHAKITPYETSEYAPGLVLQQNPRAGVEAQKGSYVELWVAMEPTSTTTTTLPTTTTSIEPPTTTTTVTIGF